MQKILIPIWSIVFRKWLHDIRVVKVKGWRTALVEGEKVSRYTITPCFSLFGIKFD